MQRLASTRAAILAALVLSACTLMIGPAADATTASSPTYYVSLGDSYAVGYQPNLNATPGFTGYVADQTHMTLVNFACSGATTTSILDTVGCPIPMPNEPNAVAYPLTTQIAAADAFISAHQGHIGLVTILIGGNDVVPCSLQSDFVPCASAAMPTLSTNVATLASDLRTAAGPSVPIIGLSYPDAYLGSYAYPSTQPSAASLQRAEQSVTVFKSLLNPTLKQAYAGENIKFLDITAWTGGYTSLSQTAQTAAYGSVPTSVAIVCWMTWTCRNGNPHGTTAGYDMMGLLVTDQYHAMAG